MVRLASVRPFPPPPLDDPIGIKEMRAGKKMQGGWERGKLYLTLRCHHKNDCIQMGSDVSDFNVLLRVGANSHGIVRKPKLLKRNRAEANSNLEVRLLISLAPHLGPSVHRVSFI